MKSAEIAARIRGLVAGQAETLSAMAERLGVHETALRISLDDVAPYPTIDVIAAVVGKYGVDPSWLLTGEYNSDSHRSTLESRTEELPRVIAALLEAKNREPGSIPFIVPSGHRVA